MLRFRSTVIVPGAASRESMAYSHRQASFQDSSVTRPSPHPRDAKESGCGCAGIYTAHAALELYATAFAAAERLPNLEAFASLNGPAFYRLPVATETVPRRCELPASWLDSPLRS